MTTNPDDPVPTHSFVDEVQSCEHSVAMESAIEHASGWGVKVYPINQEWFSTQTSDEGPFA